MPRTIKAIGVRSFHDDDNFTLDIILTNMKSKGASKVRTVRIVRAIVRLYGKTNA